MYIMCSWTSSLVPLPFCPLPPLAQLGPAVLPVGACCAHPAMLSSTARAAVARGFASGREGIMASSFRGRVASIVPTCPPASCSCAELSWEGFRRRGAP